MTTRVKNTLANIGMVYVGSCPAQNGRKMCHKFAVNCPSGHVREVDVYLYDGERDSETISEEEELRNIFYTRSRVPSNALEDEDSSYLQALYADAADLMELEIEEQEV